MRHSLVEDIVARIGTWNRPLDEFSEVESAESAIVDGIEGLVVLWAQTTTDQGVRHFGCSSLLRSLQSMMKATSTHSWPTST